MAERIFSSTYFDENFRGTTSSQLTHAGGLYQFGVSAQSILPWLDLETPDLARRGHFAGRAFGQSREAILALLPFRPVASFRKLNDLLETMEGLRQRLELEFEGSNPESGIGYPELRDRATAAWSAYSQEFDLLVPQTHPLHWAARLGRELGIYANGLGGRLLSRTPAWPDQGPLQAAGGAVPQWAASAISGELQRLASEQQGLAHPRQQAEEWECFLAWCCTRPGSFERETFARQYQAMVVLDGALYRGLQAKAFVQRDTPAPEAPAEAAPAVRWRIDLERRQVIVDGHIHPVDDPDAIRLFEAVASRKGQFIKKEELGKLFKGATDISDLYNKLPASLQAIIERKSGKRGGYSLRLP